MKASEMDKGQTIRMDGKLYMIVDFEHVKLGKGGAIYQTKLKSLADGSIQNARIRAEQVLEDVDLDERTYEYLYSAGSDHVLMDCQTYDQITVGDDVFGDGVKYLMPNMQIRMDMYEGKPVIVTLPITVDLKVVDTSPDIKRAGQQSSQTKPATLETGLVVQVPMFVKLGEVLRVDTRTGEYVTRVKE